MTVVHVVLCLQILRCLIFYLKLFVFAKSFFDDKIASKTLVLLMIFIKVKMMKVYIFFLLVAFCSINQINAAYGTFSENSVSSVATSIGQYIGKPLKCDLQSAQDCANLSRRINQDFKDQITFQVVGELNKIYAETVQFIYHDGRLFALSCSVFAKINQILDIVRQNLHEGCLTKQGLRQIAGQVAGMICGGDVESGSVQMSERDIAILRLLLEEFGADLGAGNKLILLKSCWYSLFCECDALGCAQLSSLGILLGCCLLVYLFYMFA